MYSRKFNKDNLLENRIKTNNMLEFPYSPPEFYENNQNLGYSYFKENSDVWSLGCIIYRIFFNFQYSDINGK